MWTIIETYVLPSQCDSGTKPYVLSSQCEQVFYSDVWGKAGWPYIVRYDPRGRLVKYNHLEEEEDDDEDTE